MFKEQKKLENSINESQTGVCNLIIIAVFELLLHLHSYLGSFSCCSLMQINPTEIKVQFQGLATHFSIPQEISLVLQRLNVTQTDRVG